MDISIIIVEYKNVEIVRRAVLSVSSHVKSMEYEIIVVSNSSYGSGDQQGAQEAWKNCRIVFQDNVGFSSAVNRGIGIANGKYVMLLNPDAEFFNSSLDHAVEFMDKHSDVAVIGPQIFDNKTETQDSCRDFMTFKILLKRISTRLLMKSSGSVLDKRDYSVPSPVDWVCGACMMVRSSAIAQSGLMDERYFMYVEDMDWCRRFRINGWQVWYLPYWTIEHNASRGSSGKTGINNRLMWIHIASLTKYMLKWFTTTHEESDSIGK